MSNLTPIERPTLQPLQNSFEYDQLESELKAIFIEVFESMIRERERRLNLYGMPHLGDTDLIERALKDSGLAIVRRDDTRMSFLLKAARSRNPRRGMIFLRQYLQSVWPNVWQVQPLWHPIASAANYPHELTPLGVKTLYVANGVTVTAEYASETVGGDPTGVYRTDWQGKQLLYTTPRTNLLENSQDISASYWGKSQCTVTSTNALAPDGTNTACTVSRSVPSGTNTYVLHEDKRGSYAGQTLTWSIFLKNGTYDGTFVLFLRDSPGANHAAARFNLNTGEVNTLQGTGSIQHLPDGWFRCAVTAQLPEDAGGGYLVIVDPDDNGKSAASGGDTYLMWGGQLENRALSGYIATASGPVTVTDYTIDANGVARFSDGVTPTSPLTHFRTSRIRVTLPVSSDNGLGLNEIGKAFRSTLASRLMLELRLSTIFENKGDAGGLAIANGMTAVMPILAFGTLK